MPDKGPLLPLGLRKKIGAAMGDFRMIAPGDRILIGLSGGKDSLMLTLALAEFRRRSPVRFSLRACTVDITAGRMDTAPLEAFCASLSIPHTTSRHPIAEIIETRNERSPCSLCANMRRGILNARAKDEGCNLLALGHNLDDAVETVLMNLFQAGRFKAFQPKYHQSRSDITVIRPLVLVEEQRIAREARRLGLPVLPYVCPFSLGTERSRTKDILVRLSADNPRIKYNIVRALRTLDQRDRWSPKDDGPGDYANDSL